MPILFFNIKFKTLITMPILKLPSRGAKLGLRKFSKDEYKFNPILLPKHQFKTYVSSTSA